MMDWNNTTIENVVSDEGLLEDVYGDISAINLSTSTNEEFFPPFNLAELFAFFETLQFKVADFLWQRLSIVFAIISVVGNCFIIAVLTKKIGQHLSTPLFIMSLALADLFCSGYLIDGFLGSNGYVKGSYNSFDCKFRLFLPVLGNDASPLTLTLVSIERVFCVVVPHKVKNIFTRKVSLFLLLLVWSISLATTCLYSYVHTFVITPYGEQICVIPSQEINVPYRMAYITNQVVKYGTWIINVTCMIIITQALLKNTVVKSGKTPVKSVTLSLFTVNLVYFLFMTPIIVYDGYVLTYLGGRRMNIFELNAHLNLHNILQFLSNVNNVLNIFIYFLIGSKFRKESKEFLLSFKVFKMCFQEKGISAK